MKPVDLIYSTSTVSSSQVTENKRTLFPGRATELTSDMAESVGKIGIVCGTLAGSMAAMAAVTGSGRIMGSVKEEEEEERLAEWHPEEGSGKYLPGHGPRLEALWPALHPSCR